MNCRTWPLVERGIFERVRIWLVYWYPAARVQSFGEVATWRWRCEEPQPSSCTHDTKACAGRTCKKKKNEIKYLETQGKQGAFN